MTSDRLAGALSRLEDYFGHSVKWAIMCRGRRDRGDSAALEYLMREGW